MTNLLDNQYFEIWKTMLTVDLSSAFSQLQSLNQDVDSFKFYTSVSVISSSRIEGETMETDSYVKHKILNVEYLPELTEKPNDLYRAYQFAAENNLTETTFLHAHKLLSEHLLPEHHRGILRSNPMIVLEHATGRIQYEAAPASLLPQLFSQMFLEINSLLIKDLTIEKVFYYAAYIHLIFVNIHPFNDGNGRAARLLEKWFLAEKLGERAWMIASEKHYYQFVNEYYMNLAHCGMFYENLDYSKSLPFLLMLPNSLYTQITNNQ